MSNFSQQSTTYPANGAYFQPTPGVALSGVEPYRDAQITAQAAASAAAPGALGTVATVTPGTAGLWEVSGTISISGTTVAAAETNNMQLRQTTTARLTNIPIGVNGVTGAPGVATFGPVILNLSAADTVNVVAVGASTASSIYGAQIVCRLVG